MLGGELQRGELLLEAVEAPWKEENGGESSDGEVEMGSTLHPGGLASKRMRDVASGQDGRGKQQQRRGSRRQGELGEETRQWQVEHARVQCRSRWDGASCCRCIVDAAQSQVILQGPAGREIWLGVDLRRRGATERSQAGCRVVSCRGELQAMVTGLQA